MTLALLRKLCSLLASLAWLALSFSAGASDGQLTGSSDALAPDGIDWDEERQFWSFRLPETQPLPNVRNMRWPQQPLDFFTLSTIERNGLSPSPAADRRTLLRRLAFDLTGLPPTPAEADAFVADRRPDAYDQMVERLLASPRFGERMASMWLPLARYAEDQAHQVGSDTKFFYPNAHKYREWVIDAFNRDLPYDQFVRLQLAADKIEGTNGLNLAALGFLGLGPKYYNRGRVEVMADEWEDRVDTVTRTFLGLTVSCSRCHDHKFDPITVEDYYALAGVFASTRMVNQRPDGKPEEDKTDAAKMDPDTLHVVADGKVKDLNVFLRGNADRKGPVAARRFLRVLSDDTPIAFKDGSGRRELAEAIADSSNPLAARVVVNRVWAMFFGKPLVPSPSNFGHSGERPTQPELLDDLASRFVENGWSIKELVREFVLSATYQQASVDLTTKLSAAKLATAQFAGMPRRRLSIEQWRDAVLLVTGELDLSLGRSVELDDPANHRRTVHARISRLKLNDVLMQFDYPDANVHAEQRAVTTTAIQKLFVLNSPFMLERAGKLAARLTEQEKEDSARISNAYRMLFGRTPTPEEVRIGLGYLSKPAAGAASRWDQYAQALLASNEMLYVD